MTEFDAIVIGTGQAGPSLALRLAGAGMKVAIAERKLFGGTCVNTGCTPTKALVASAYAARMARRAAEYGVAIAGDIGVDMKRVKARKDAIVAQSRDGLTAALESAANLHGLSGPCPVWSRRARSRSAHERLARRADLHQCRRPRGGAAMPGLDQVPISPIRRCMEVDFLPRHLVIIGGSYIGLEFGQMYRRFGSEVTVVEMAPRLVAREDEDVSAAIKEIVEREGVNVRLNAECISLSKRGNDIVAAVDCTDGAPEVVGLACAARGRAPAEHRRSRPRPGRGEPRRARLHYRRR